MDISAVVEGINAKAAAAPPLGNTLKIDFGEHQVHVDGTGDQNVVTASDADADCVIIITTENFMKLVKGELNPMMAVMTGKVKIKGDMGVAMKLQSLVG
ncbi:MAG: SCP2 sterol-binding domain-containing protein [Lewinella sp.]|uniref:SCP2 sterol-binding domain-containing protein n=1 Tax=Lewinella sp. TaxID=2004506 RepID=UPI003D6A6637